MNTYTIILQFAKGTYVSQRRAKNEVGALKAWIRNPDSEMLAGVGYAERKALWVSRIEFGGHGNCNNLVPLTGLRSVWFFMFLQGKTAGYVNVVKTNTNT